MKPTKPIQSTVDERLARYTGRAGRVERDVVSKIARGNVWLINRRYLKPEEIKEQMRLLTPRLVNFK